MRATRPGRHGGRRRGRVRRAAPPAGIGLDAQAPRAIRNASAEPRIAVESRPLRSQCLRRTRSARCTRPARRRPPEERRRPERALEDHPEQGHQQHRQHVDDQPGAEQLLVADTPRGGRAPSPDERCQARPEDQEPGRARPARSARSRDRDVVGQRDGLPLVNALVPVQASWAPSRPPAARRSAPNPRPSQQVVGFASDPRSAPPTRWCATRWCRRSRLDRRSVARSDVSTAPSRNMSVEICRSTMRAG